jgi:hypothetical protein
MASHTTIGRTPITNKTVSRVAGGLRGWDKPFVEMFLNHSSNKHTITKARISQNSSLDYNRLLDNNPLLIWPFMKGL